MTKRECAIIMAHTGICMLVGDDFNIFHKYCEDLLGHPIFTHQFPMYEKEIKERSFEDFKELCACSTVELQRTNGRWIDTGRALRWECSNCGRLDNHIYNYCPDCGVKMRNNKGEWN